VTRLVPTLAVLAAAALVVMGWTGKLPHQWFGLSTADLLGLAILAIPALLVLLGVGLLVRWVWQTREGVRSIAWYLHDQAPRQRRGNVIQGPWNRRSG
jgi:hypothetical protein